MTTGQFGPSLSFSPIARQYDARYEIPVAQLMTCYERLRASEILPRRGVILDAGCGTGQMSLPLAEIGYEVRGYDISPEMIEVARSKVGAGLSARYDVADVRALPEASGAVDTVIVCKLFIHVSDWENAARELLRVLRPGGSLVLLNDAIALENSVRTFFGQQADAAGFTDRFVGLRPGRRKDLVALLEANECTEVRLDGAELSWSRKVSFGTIIEQFRDRLFAEFWLMPVAKYDAILAETTQWVDSLPLGRDTVETIVPSLHVQVFRKHG
jgi:ubiquinone/menaquinone biosynthesis C-methylase UbiE